MGTARELHMQVLVATLFVFLPASVRMTEGDCKCCSDVLKAVEKLKEELKLLNDEVSASKNDINNLQQPFMRAQGDIQDLKAGVNKVSTTIQEDESKIRQIQADISEMKAERTDLREAVERVKRDLHQDRLQTNQSIAAVHAETKRLAEVLMPPMQRIMASLPNKLAKIERLDKAGQRVMELLASSQRETNIPDTNQDHSSERKKAASTPTQKIHQSVPTEVSSQGSAGEENHDNELLGYTSQLERVTNPFPLPFHNVSIRDVQGFAADNDSYVLGNVSNTFLKDGNLTQRAFDGIGEIELVGAEENFPIVMRESDIGGCTGFGTSNHSASTTPSAPCYHLTNDSEKNSDQWNNNELPIENVMRVMAQKLLNLQKIFDDGACVSRVSQLEDRSALVNANLSELHLLVSSYKALDTDAIKEMETTIANMSDVVNEALVKLEKRVLTELDGRTAENTRNTTAVWESLQSILNRIEEIEFGLNSTIAKDDSLRLMNVSLATLEAQLLALNDSVETAGSEEIMELKSELRNLSESLQAPISDFDRRIQQSLSLTSALKEALDNVTSWLEVVSENAKKSVIAGDLKLQTITEELGRVFRAEKLKQDMQNVTDSLLGIQGGHPGFGVETMSRVVLLRQYEHMRQEKIDIPLTREAHADDSSGCPGLNVLAADDRLVMSTNPGGRFSAPNLPSDRMPLGAVVRFHCMPAGTYRLVGARQLTCLGTKRWSSPPPTCEPLPTLEQPLGNSSDVAVPSIVHDGLVDDEWASADDEGRLVVRPGRRLRLKCLYPAQKGTVFWLHNNTDPRDASFELVRERPDDNKFHAYQMEIGSATPDHSGTYSCETEDGKRHSLSIMVADVTCEKPKSRLNGELEVTSPGPISVGKKVQFLCDMGYNLTGSEEIICLGSGRWSIQPPTCE
ncbi:uncharacterized protein LOC144103397 [Amblyomma americanum]